VRAGWRCLLFIVGCSGCAGDLDNPERFNFLLDSSTKADADVVADTTPPACMTSLFTASCGLGASCHAPDATQSQVDLVSPGVAERLLDVESKTAVCEGRVLVTTDGTASLLLQKLMGGMPPCGVAMPLGPPLTAEQLTCVSGWVNKVSKAGGGT
jgi:hypothetical protein